MSSYYLPHYAYYCLVDNQFVFLDLRNDKYLGLDVNASRILLQLLGQESANYLIADLSSVKASNEIDQIAKDLMQQGLLTKSRAEGKAVLPVVMNTPNNDLMGFALGLTPTIRLRHVAQVFKASLLSAARLRYLSLKRIIEQVKRRKQRYSKHISQNDSEQLHELVETFKILRPLLFTAKNRCLYDALVLLEFLSYYRFFPNWVFGVTMGPFRAHCWVQNEDFIFNDAVANVAPYTPILIV